MGYPQHLTTVRIFHWTVEIAVGSINTHNNPQYYIHATASIKYMDACIISTCYAMLLTTYISIILTFIDTEITMKFSPGSTSSNTAKCDSVNVQVLEKKRKVGVQC